MVDGQILTPHAAISPDHAVLQFTEASPITAGEHTVEVSVRDLFGNQAQADHPL